MFAAVSTILKENMAQHLEVMVKAMLCSLKSTEGITVSCLVYSKKSYAKCIEIHSNIYDLK